MRALTLTQPWAGLVASGIKLIENRPRSVIKRADFGQQFAIHASRQIDEAVYQRIDQLWPRCGMYMGDNDATCPVLTCRRRDGHVGDCDNVRGEDDDKEWIRLSRITSAVIAVATVVRSVSPSEFDTGAISDVQQHRWYFGPIGYVLRDVRAVATAVPCRGALGFWSLPADVERAVLEQLR